jgi:PIN domain nuclease of toxin-antitoxin system
VTEVLLDTHALLWFVFDDPRISPTAAEMIADGSVTKYLSVISLWEIVIKSQLGRLRLGMPIQGFFSQYISGSDLSLVDIELSHLLAYDALPLIHGDPFDRILLAQAKVLSQPILSADPMMARYGIDVLW